MRVRRRRWSALLLRLRSSERRGSRTPLSKHRGRAEVHAPRVRLPRSCGAARQGVGSRAPPSRIGAIDANNGVGGLGAARYAGCVTFTRITVQPGQMGGVPCIRGLRIPVATVVGMLADGMATAEILDAYPDLEPDDLREALRYAAEAVRERELPLTATG